MVGENQVETLVIYRAWPHAPEDTCDTGVRGETELTLPASSHLLLNSVHGRHLGVVLISVNNLLRFMN